jgi:hypothetical protein
LGAFGTHANPAARHQGASLRAARRERGRRRRVAIRTNQFNARVSDEAIEFAKLLIDRWSSRDGKKWSQADLIEQLIAEAAKAEKIVRSKAK